MCTFLPDIEYVEFEEQYKPPFNLNDTVPFRCQSGYYVKYKPEITCSEINGKGKWIYDPNPCAPVSCNQPPHVDNGKYKGLLFTYPYYVTYECNDGFKLIGLPKRYCSANGIWQPRQIPRCEKLDCPELIIPDHCQITYTNISNNKIRKAHYVCDKGYVLQGLRERTCGSNKIWTGKDPKCVPNTCSAPEQYANGFYEPIKDVYVDGDTIKYKCPSNNYTFSAICHIQKWIGEPKPCVPLSNDLKAVSYSSSNINILVIIILVIVIVLIACLV